LWRQGVHELHSIYLEVQRLQQVKEETNVKIFALSAEDVQKALGHEEASIRASDSVSEAIVHELGEDFFVEITQAHRFKEEFQKRRKRVTK
jgi:uncharacterized protein YabE (DUF348 family)